MSDSDALFAEARRMVKEEIKGKIKEKLRAEFEEEKALEMTRLTALHTNEMSAMKVKVSEEQMRTESLETITLELQQQIASLEDQQTVSRKTVKQAKREIDGWKDWCGNMTAKLKQEHGRNGPQDGHPAPITSVRYDMTNLSGSSNSGSKVGRSTNSKKKMYVIETINAVAVNPHGLTLYRVGWKGYGPDRDTWEPLMNIAKTGHVDRFYMKQRAMFLQVGKPGVAEVVFNDEGTRIKMVVDLSQMTFRAPSDKPRIRSEWDEENDYSVVNESSKLEIYWEYAGVYVPCKVLSWTPLSGTRVTHIVQPHFNNAIARAFEQELNLFRNYQSDRIAGLAKSHDALNDAVKETNQDNKDLLSEKTKLEGQLDVSRNEIFSLIKNKNDEKKAWEKEKESLQAGIQKQLTQMKQEHAEAVAIATSKTAHDMKVLQNSYDERVNAMKEEHNTLIDTMANASMHRENTMKADHNRILTETRTFYQGVNDQKLAANKNYYEEQLASLRLQMTQGETRLHQQYNGRLESKDSMIREQIRAQYEIEEAQSVTTGTSSPGSTITSNDDALCRHSKKRKMDQVISKNPGQVHNQDNIEGDGDVVDV